MADEYECEFELPVEVMLSSEKQIIKELIFNLEAFPELWDTSAKAYSDKLKRSAAYKKLLQVLKKIKPTATVDDVRKKINSLKSNYRKDLKRIADSKRSGEVYTPISETFKALQFLQKTEMPVNAVVVSEYDDSVDFSSSQSLEQLDDSSFSSLPPQKKTKLTSIAKENELIKKKSLLLSDKPELSASNINVTAIYWSERLEKLEPQQRTFAQKAINDILLEAELGTLNRNSIKINQYTTSRVTSPEPNDRDPITYECFEPVSSEYHRMESPKKYFRRVCRICRSFNLSLDWNEELDEFVGMSYKDCFYKYSQFKKTSRDPLSRFLCEVCANGVKSFYLLVEKAMETRLFCQQSLAVVDQSLSGKKFSPVKGDQINPKEDYDYEYVFQSAEINDFSQHKNNAIDSVNDIDDGMITESESIDKNPSNELSNDMDYGMITESESIDNNQSNELSNLDANEKDPVDVEELIAEDVTKNESNDMLNSEYILSVERATNAKDPLKSSDVNQPYKRCTRNVSSLLKEKKLKPKTDSIILDFIDEPKSKSRIDKTPVMCSYCSKMVHNIYDLKRHEQTHAEHRAREVSCPTCGVKFFDKLTLNQHKKIHDTNRIKKFKCEFCDKAFFTRGDCNIHRRIHLGQMIPCQLCPKEFCRQADLDRHMPTHSHETLSARAKKRKYFVHCKECGKKVKSDKFVAHQAMHIKDPYLRCTVCEKDFFSRPSATCHMAGVHKRKAGDYDDIALYYKSKNVPRQSFLKLIQQEDVEPVV